MKYNLYLVLLLVYSCKENKPIINTDAKVLDLPYVLISKNDTNLSLKNDTLFLKRSIFSGYVYQLYSNQKDTFSIAHFRNGILNGVSKKYYPGNQLMEYRIYLNGAKNGLQISYWKNSNKRFEFTAKDDAYEGELKEWSEIGGLFHLAHFKNGQEDGEQKLWYDNGKIKANYVIKNGRRYGLLGTKNCTNITDSVFIIK